jgi:hypothetical protein
VDGTLTLESEGHTVTVEGSGRRVVVDVDDLSVLRTLLQQKPSNHAAGQLDAFLRDADLDVEVRCKGHPIARLGTEADPGWIEKMFQIKGIDVHARGLLKSLFGKRG